MQRLRGLGCQVGLDDFGSGLSSFDYLKSLPVDFLKIDGKFVRNVASDAVDLSIVEAIQRIGRALKIRIVAECVEDEDALAALRAIGVDFAQGVHVHRPMPFASLIGEMQKSTARATGGRAERLRLR